MVVKSYRSLPTVCGVEDRRSVKFSCCFLKANSSFYASPTFHMVRKIRILMAKKGNSEDNTRTQKAILSPKPTKSFLARSALVLFGLGFVDAGYSGDWSRIGVITRDIEEVLKISAFLVVPLCLFLVFTISDQEAVSDE